jgi:hypothetical protein
VGHLGEISAAPAASVGAVCSRSRSSRLCSSRRCRWLSSACTCSRRRPAGCACGAVRAAASSVSSAARACERRHGERRHSERRHGERRHGERRHGERRHSERRHGKRRHGERRHGERRHGERRHSERRHGERRHSERVHSERVHGERIPAAVRAAELRGAPRRRVAALYDALPRAPVRGAELRPSPGRREAPLHLAPAPAACAFPPGPPDSTSGLKLGSPTPSPGGCSVSVRAHTSPGPAGRRPPAALR